jgi:hypothetical protein
VGEEKLHEPAVEDAADEVAAEEEPSEPVVEVEVV